MIDLKQKIYLLLSSDSTLRTLLGATTKDSRIYPAMAAQFENFPCITYTEVSSPFRTVPDGAYDPVIEFSIYVRPQVGNPAKAQTDMENIYSRLNQLMNYYPQAPNVDTTNRPRYCIQETAIDMSEKDRSLYRKIVRYRFWVINN